MGSQASIRRYHERHPQILDGPMVELDRRSELEGPHHFRKSASQRGQGGVPT